MKKINLKIWVVSVLILAIASSIGASSVSALSADGESLLSGLVSAGSSAGDLVGGIVDNFVSTTKASTTVTMPSNANPEEDLDKVLEEIGIKSDILLITDLVSYLNRGGTFIDWVYDNYGVNVEIPDSVKAMSTKELVLYLMGTILYPDATTETGETTTPKYVFSTEATESETLVTQTEPTVTTRPAEISTSENTTEAIVAYVTGDIDFDGRVTATDARLALRASASLETLEGTAFYAADVNGDGRVTANDARSILRYAAKITSGF